MTNTNKINFYLIKSGIVLDQVFKDPISSLKKNTIKEGFTLYYNERNTVPAPWVKSFLKTEIKEKRREGEKEKDYHVFNTASSQAVLVRIINIGTEERIFVICFGSGFHLLKKDAYEPKFGLISVLNLVGENSLRRLDKHDISGTPKHTAEQLSKKGSQVDFGLNVDLDIMLAVTGSLNDKVTRERKLQKFIGTTLSGGASFSVSAKFDIDNIDRLLKFSHTAFKSKKYEKKGFAWIDQIELIKKETPLHSDLVSRVDELLKAKNKEKMWLAVPELVNWQDIKGFYFKRAKDNLFSDVTFDALESVIEEDLSVEMLRSIRVKALHSDEKKDAYSWDAYECLYAEINFDNQTYVLINSEWYRIKQDFVKDTNDKYKTIITDYRSDLKFKEYEESDKNENGYNESMASQISNSVLMDADNISHGGGKSKIEFCDIFDKDQNRIIHIKKYSGSSVLSHLFSQGFVSAKLLQNDSKFRSKVEERIEEVSSSKYSFDLKSDYKVVFGIISKSDKTEIPFFSKVNLNNVFNSIRNMRGYTAEIAFIKNNAPLQTECGGKKTKKTQKKKIQI